MLSVVERREDSSETTPTNGPESKEGAGGDHESKEGAGGDNESKEGAGHEHESKEGAGHDHGHVTELKSQDVEPITRKKEEDSGPSSTASSPSPPSGETLIIEDYSTLFKSDSTSPTKKKPDLNVRSKRTNSIGIKQEVESLGYETDISASTLDTMSAKTSLTSELKSNESSLKCVADSPAKPRRAIPRLYTKTKIVESPENSEHSSENHLSQKISRDAQDSIIPGMKTVESAPPAASLMSGSESTPAKDDKKASSSPTKSMIPTKSSKSPRDDLARTKSLKKVSTALKTLSSMTSSKIPKVSFSRAKPPPAKGPFMYSQTSTVTKPKNTESDDLKPPKTSSVLLFSSVEHEIPKQSESSEAINKSLNVNNISNNNNDTETVESEKLSSDNNNLTPKDSLTSTTLSFDLSNTVSEIDEDTATTKKVTTTSSVTSKTDTGVQSQPERVEAATSPYISEEEGEEEQKRPMREHLKYLKGNILDAIEIISVIEKNCVNEDIHS